MRLFDVLPLYFFILFFLFSSISMMIRTTGSSGATTMPVLGSLPVTPITIQIMVRYPLILPRLSSPPMNPVIIPPTRIKISVKPGCSPVITPPSVIISGAVPTPFPWTPPPASGEEYFFLHIRDGVDIHARYYYHLGWRRKNNRRRQRKSNMHTYLGHC